LKVLLLTPNFWTSGTVTFLRELQTGWPAEWPRPPIAVPTRSGKRSVKWGRALADVKRADSTPWEPDICDTSERLVHLAREYDLVHVNEAETTPATQEWWYELLERLDTPWTLQLHGNPYERVHWARLIHARRFTGVTWQTPGNLPAPLYESQVRGQVTLVELPRPWNPRTPITETGTWSPSDALPPRLGFHGRLAPDKGVAHVAALAKHLDLPVCLHGASPGGGFPYALGLQERYLGAQLHPAEAPWTATEVPLHYAGPYEDGVRVSRRHAVHVSATRRGFSGGTEYTLLEAVDAGCRIVQPLHMREPGVHLQQFAYRWEPRGLKGALDDELTDLSVAVRAALDVTDYDPSYNRTAIARHHEPARLARDFFGVAAQHS
jgi:hypothetical protein